ncbi:hypothetical protein SDRG_10005 [Saprolegnia diclina VS20]|uniref:CBS domain-containing protein n=1 Tax=Saprolegnia diclina (strain VS20) TaxID=1156394 RepID=T0QC16_SAPDV|nr:hypothetical protein SDRG_10005 [Saprolegnia diclina VS20]EQC32256.1 hypothetical protein SDRG_10005 [Saprolegnia diclina VS20]|eukprot:XP_008614197.1 hypothetical protein SDRG_10005 [Saprolegnia diclina VS20]
MASEHPSRAQRAASEAMGPSPSGEHPYGRRMSEQGYTSRRSLDDAMDVDMGSLGSDGGGFAGVRIAVPPLEIPSSSLGELSNFRLDAYKEGNLDLSMSMDAYAMNVIEEGRRVIRHFLETCKCYDVIKNSGKVVVFDVKIPMNLAFFALVEHHIKSVPLWDADQGCFVGMFTSTDFVNILRHFYSTGSPMNAAAEHSIASWKALSLRMNLLPPTHSQMLYVSPEDSLLSALLLLRTHQLHRLAVLDTQQNSVLSILTHFGILEYLVSTFREQRRLFDQSIVELGIGTFTNLITVPEDTPLIHVLHTLMEQRISAVPIVDASGAVVNLYSVSDVTELVKDRTISTLDAAVGDILRVQQAEGILGDNLHFCSQQDTLHMLFEKFAAAKAHHLVCADESRRCVGIVALSDLFNYFLQ